MIPPGPLFSPPKLDQSPFVPTAREETLEQKYGELSLAHEELKHETLKLKNELVRKESIIASHEPGTEEQRIVIGGLVVQCTDLAEDKGVLKAENVALKDKMRGTSLSTRSDVVLGYLRQRISTWTIPT